MTLKDMIDRQIELDEAYAEAQHLADAAKDARDRHEYELHERMADEGFTEGDDIKHRGSRWGYQVDWYAKVQDPLAFIEWAEANEPHLIQPKPQKSLLNKLVVQAQEDGAELPPGLAANPKMWVSRRAV